MSIQHRLLNPEIAAILPKLMPPSPPWTSEGIRTVRRQAIAVDTTCSNTDSREVFEVYDTVVGGVPARVYQAGRPPCPTILFAHGGGWVAGDLDTHDFLARQISRATASIIVSLGYKRPPEAVFPRSLSDCTNALDAIVSSVETYGGVPELIGLAGDSAGANLMAALALKRAGELRSIAAQLLIYPALDLAGHYADASINSHYPSRGQNSGGPALSLDLLSWLARVYCPSSIDAEQASASPLRVADHSGIPPTIVAVAECDPLRDEGTAYAKLLEGAGVTARVHRGLGLVHGYFGLTSICKAATVEAQTVLMDFSQLLRAQSLRLRDQAGIQ